MEECTLATHVSDLEMHLNFSQSGPMMRVLRSMSWRKSTFDFGETENRPTPDSLASVWAPTKRIFSKMDDFPQLDFPEMEHMRILSPFCRLQVTVAKKVSIKASRGCRFPKRRALLVEKETQSSESTKVLKQTL